jgi:general secretion pathway protein B
VLLISTNLAVLGYFLGFAEKNPATETSQQVQNSPVTTVLEPPQVTIKKLQPVPVSRNPDSKVSPNSGPTVNKTAPELPAVPEKIPLKLVEAIDVVSPEPLSVPIQKIEVARNAKVEPVSADIKNDLPYLDDLPVAVRRAIPGFTINVYGYAAEPAQRFVMIDLVKYVPGQRIKDSLELREILADSMVVSYEDVVFKIKRP